MFTQLYIPTEEELKEIGFSLSWHLSYWSLGIPGGNIYYSHKVPGVREDDTWSIYFYGSSIGARKFYPRSREHLEQIIQAFTPPK